MCQEAGVQPVVVAHIATREIVTYGSDGAERTFATGDTLTLEPILPSFACPLDDLFAV